MRGAHAVGLITGDAPEFTPEALAANGVDFVIAKPFHLQTILDAVSRR